MKLTDVRALNLTNCGIQTYDIARFSEYLEKNPMLVSVTLDANKINAESMDKITKMLVSNRNLKHLSLKNCKELTEETLEQFAETIE